MSVNMEYDARKKSTLLAYLGWAFLGGLGVHRFYLGHSGSGALLLGTFLIGFLFPPLWIVTGVWLIIDLFLVAGMVQEYNLGLARSLTTR